MVGRRGFLKSLLGVGLVAVTDPERLLWEPDKKLISVPATFEDVTKYAANDAGVSIRFIRGYDISQAKFITRLDVAIGAWPLIFHGVDLGYE